MTRETKPTPIDQLNTPEEAGEVRQRLRQEGWQADLGWADVGAGSAAAAVRAAGDREARRTIAYLASLRALDHGAPRVWKDGDVPVPPEADAREVMVAEPDLADWRSEVFEAPVETVETPEAAETDAGEQQENAAEAERVA